MVVKLVLQLISLLWLIEPLAAAAPSMVKPGCRDSCGNNVSIPYPFGIGKGCYHDKWYEKTCTESTQKPFLHKFNLEVLNISLPLHEVRLNSPIGSTCKNGSSWTSTDFRGSPFQFSYRNIFTVLQGCYNALLFTRSGEILGGCTSTCKNITTKGCNGINCCQTSIPLGLDIYSVNTTGNTTVGCTYAFLVDRDWLPGNVSIPSVVEHVPVVMGWTITNLANVPIGNFPDYTCYSGVINWVPTYSCSCQDAHEGNPFIPGGCKVVRACADCKGNCIADQQGKYSCKHSKTREKVAVLGANIGGGACF